MPEFEPITRIRIRAKIRGFDGVLSDPTTLECTVHEPDGTETTYVWGTDVELVKEDSGEFYLDWDASQAGQHKYRWQADGVIVASFGGSFNIRRPKF